MPDWAALHIAPRRDAVGPMQEISHSGNSQLDNRPRGADRLCMQTQKLLTKDGDVILWWMQGRVCVGTLYGGKVGNVRWIGPWGIE